jgi:hypothetical protein
MSELRTLCRPHRIISLWDVPKPNLAGPSRNATWRGRETGKGERLGWPPLPAFRQRRGRGTALWGLLRLHSCLVAACADSASMGRENSRTTGELKPRGAPPCRLFSCSDAPMLPRPVFFLPAAPWHAASPCSQHEGGRDQSIQGRSQCHGAGAIVTRSIRTRCRTNNDKGKVQNRKGQNSVHADHGARFRVPGLLSTCCGGMARQPGSGNRGNELGG